MKIIVKIGGVALEDKTTLHKCAHAVVDLARDGHKVAVVHGGGSTLTRTLALLGKKSDFVNGLRITDAETRDVALMVLAGMVNKGVVAAIVAAGNPAIGLCGGDGMPAYTHLQRAEPVLVGHWLLAYVEMFLRDADRLADCRKRLNVGPLGSGAIAGTTLPLDRRLMSSELGFDAPTANSMDATSDRDFVIEFVNALTVLALHLSRWAEEMILFSTQEYGFVHLPEAYSTGSSAMPQKKNADLLELTRAKAGRVLGNATALMSANGLPLY